MDLELRFLRRLDTSLNLWGLQVSGVTCLQFLEQLNIKPSQVAFHLMGIDHWWQFTGTLMEEWLVGTGIVDTLGPLSLLFAGGTYSSCLCDETVPHLEGCLSNFWSNWRLEEKLKMNLVYLEVNKLRVFIVFCMVKHHAWTTMLDSLLRMPAARPCPRGCQNLEGPSCYILVVWLNFSTPAQRRR